MQLDVYIEKGSWLMTGTDNQFLIKANESLFGTADKC